MTGQTPAFERPLDRLLEAGEDGPGFARRWERSAEVARFHLNRANARLEEGFTKMSDPKRNSFELQEVDSLD